LVPDSFRSLIAVLQNSVITLIKRITLPSCSMFGDNTWHKFVHCARCEGTLPFFAVLLEPPESDPLSAAFSFYVLRTASISPSAD
jgi:hypothetical protein